MAPALGLSATAGINEVALTWENPEDPSPEGVYVEVVGPQPRVIAIPGAVTEAKVSGLRNGVTYSFRVITATSDGSAKPSDTVRATPTTGAEGVVAGVIVEFAETIQVSEGAQSVPGDDRINTVDLSVAEKVTDDAVLVEFSEPVDLATAEQIASDLAADELVQWAEPDQFLFTANDTTNPTTSSATTDALSSAWNLSGTYGVDATAVQDREQAGEGVTVAVIDTGITNHPNLQGNIVDGYDFVSSPEQLMATRQPNAPPVAFDADYQDTTTHGPLGRDANPTDPGDWRDTTPVRASSWHGTKMAGLIHDVAPGASIQPIRALSWRGGLLSDIAASITWASGGDVDGVPANANPSKVINMSFAVETICPTALQQAIDAARERGSILIAAAGNANDDAAKYAPGNCNGVITVGSTTDQGMRADYSNYGATIDIAAPGGDTTTPINATSNTGTTTPDQPTRAGDFGTSVSAAHVSAGAAILAARNTTITPDEAFTTLTGRESVKAFANPTCDTNPDYSCGTGILTLAQIATISSGDQDYAMSFLAASSQYAQTSSTSVTSSMSDAFTIEAWVRPTSCANSTFGTVLSVEYSFWIACLSTGEWYADIGFGGSWSSYRSISTGVFARYGEWQHIAFTRSARNAAIEFYFNGVLAHSAAAWDYAPGSGQPLYVGWRPGHSSLFNGQIDELRLYSTYRGGSIATDMHTYGPTSTSGLVAYYDFNEGPAGTTGTGTIYNRADSAAAGTNLRTVNGPTYTDVKQTTSNGNNTVVTFPRSYLTAAGGWRVPQGVTSARTLVVAGGGGGGDSVDNLGWQGAGGGAGGYVASDSAELEPGSVVTATVGMGGKAGLQYSLGYSYVDPTNGQDSVLGNVRAVGGGFGGYGKTGGPSGGINGGDGGSGGGGGMYLGNGGTGTAGQGNAGGNSAGSGNYASGGGGGSGSAGTAGSGSGTSATGGNGGQGTSNSISGSAVFYAAGGNAKGCAANGSASGQGQTAVGVSGSANSGSGGGGGGDASGCPTGDLPAGAGGSGVVIVSYSTVNTTCAPFESFDVDANGVVYKVLRWSNPSPTDCTWTVPGGVTTVDYLVVGGGGGGGGHIGGGGGGGEVVDGRAIAVSGTLNIKVGAGGTGGVRNAPNPSTGSGRGASGGPSTLGSVVAAGGGGGATVFGEPLSGGSGGGSSGGGVGVKSGGVSTASGTGRYGNAGGGTAGNLCQSGAGGGGGAGGVGDTVGSSVQAGGAGGNGISSSISGVAASYGGGGGGGVNGGDSAGFCRSSGRGGSGGSGGGGNGGLNPSSWSSVNSATAGQNGIDGTGGGGGGATGNGALNSNEKSGGDGGDGVVIVRYAVADADACVPFEYTYTSGGTPYTVVEFQGAGTCSWTPPTGVTRVDVLAVGGGGGGGNRIGGGGGGGAVVESSAVSVSGAIPVTVGEGGRGGYGTSALTVGGAQGGQSAFGAVVAVGGGGGGGDDGFTSGVFQSPTTGGGGGGGGWNGSLTPGINSAGASGSPGGGGGSSTFVSNPPIVVTAGGGGGGAALAGTDAEIGGNGTASSGGVGGSGGPSSITGVTVNYGGGGGGGMHTDGQVINPGPGGIGGGGGGATLAMASAFSGTDGLGGGGGGGSVNSADTNESTGGDGGDGVVIVRYYSNWLSLSDGGAQQPSDYTYSPVVADWDSVAPKVQLIDANGTALSTSGVVVTATFTATSGSATLSGATATTDANGVADFSSLILDGDAGTSGTLTFDATGYGSVTSSSVTIGQAPLTVTADNQSVAYGTAASTVTGAGSVTYSGFVNSETSTVVSGTVTYTTTYSNTTDAGTAGVTITPVVSGLSATNYSFTAANGTVTVAKASQAALTLTSTSGTYGTAVTLATSGGTTAGSLSYVVADGTASGCAESSGSLTSSTGGTCTVTATMAGNTNYNPVSSSATTVTLAKVNLTMTGVTAANKIYSGNDSATLSFAGAALVGVVSGDTASDVTFDASSAVGTFTSTAVGTNIPVTVSGVTLTGTKAASSYTLSQPTGVTADIEPATRTLAFSTTSYGKTYGDAAFTVTATPSAGTGTITYSSTGSGCSVDPSTGEVTISSVGSCQVSASIATDGTYDPASTTTPVSVTVNAKPLTISGMTAANKEFDDSDSATLSFSSASLVGVVGSDSVSIDSSSAVGTFASPDVGTNIAVSVTGVTLSGVGASNYSLTQPSTTADITTRGLTVTATSQSITFGDSTPTPAFTSSGLQGNDAIASVTFAYSGANAPSAPTAGGSYSITPSVAVFSSGTASNYTITYSPGTYDIGTASQTISFAALADKDYGDSSFSVSATSSSSLSVSFASTTTSVCTVSGSTVTIVAAGSCTIRASQGGNGNYSAAPNVDQTFTVDPAPLVITASSPTVDYGDPIPTITPSYAGFVYGESAADLSTSPTCSTTYVTTSNAGSSPATSCSGAASANYSISYVPGSVTVNQVAVTVTAASFSLTYGDAVPTVTASYSGFVNGQDSSALSTLPACTTTYTPTSNAGTTPSTSCSGAVATNYSFAYTAGSITIAQATPTFTWSNVSKTYGDSTYTITAPTASVAGSFSYVSSASSVISISSSTATVAGAGSATITATFTPTDTTNYVSGGTVTQTVSVARAVATVTAADQSVAYSTAVSTVTGAGSVTYGLVNGDTSSVVSGTVTYTTTYTNTTDAGTAGVTITPVVTGLSADDYTFSAVPGTVTITRASQTITFAPLPSKVFGDSAFTVSATASPSGLTVAFDSTTTSVCTVSGTSVTILAAGTCTVRASQAGNVNYSAATPVDQSFSVSKRSITLTADNDTFTYGGSATPGFSVTSGSLVGSDAILSATYTYAGTGSTTYPSSTTAPTDAGTYSVTPSLAVFSSGSASNYTINYVAGSVTINKANQVIAFTSTPVATDPNDTYTPTASVVSAYSGSASGLSATFDIALSSAGACTISGGVVTFVTRNSSCVIEAEAPGDDNFNAQTSAVTQTIVIGALNQTITFARPANVAFGSSSQQMSATASSGLTVTYTPDTSQAACDVAATGVVTIKAVGACAVTALQAGDSQYAAASSVTQTFQVVPALPTAPTLTYVSPSSQSITAGFSAPGFTGGVSITGYSLVARVGGVAAASTTCASSPCTITGLVNGTNYTVTVAAINSAGTGPASSASGTITPYTSAFAVSALTPTPGNTVMDLTWTPLTNAQLGGGSFTRYEVSYRNPAVTSTWTLATSALTTQTTSSYQVSSLTNGISYDFQVVAFTTANATEVPGNTAQVVQYPSTVPSSPRTLSVLPVAGSSSLTDVQFSWSAPLSDGGAALGLDSLGNTIPSYSVTVTGSAGAASVTCTPPSNTATYCTATGLTNGASYTFSVVATNRMGNSTAANEVYNVPSADATLSDLVVTGTGGAVSLTPVFASATTTYTASVVNAVATVTVTPTTTAAGASVTVDGVTVTSGSASAAIALAVGSTAISVVVTAADPNFTETYTVTIIRAAASGGGSATGGGSTPNAPIAPPAPVINGDELGAVTVDGTVESGVVLVKTPSNSGWEAVGSDFQMTVETETPSGAPEPLGTSGAMQVPQGGRIVIAGDGYLPETMVSVFAIPRVSARMVGKLMARSVSGAVYVGSASVSAAGTVSGTFTVPTGMNVGDYVLQINGETVQAQVRSINLQMNVVPAPPTMRAGMIRDAAFYQGKSAKLSTLGKEKLRSMVNAIPKGAQDVSVVIVGVSVALDSVDANLDLARDRAKGIAKYLENQGVSGTYTVSVSTTFTVDSAERSLSGDAKAGGLDKPMESSAGKPLTTASITFEAPSMGA